MNALIIAAEAATTASESGYPGDDWAVAAWVLVGIAAVYAAVATIMVTPKAHQDH